MQDKKFVKFFRTNKAIQLCVTLVIEFVFFIILVFNPKVAFDIRESSELSGLCMLVWALMLLHLLFLLYDFYKLRAFEEESYELRKVAYLDDLTGLPNRHGMDAIFQTYHSPASMTGVGCYWACIKNLAEINLSLGRIAGDNLLRDFGKIFEEVSDEIGFAGRNGGNDFIMIVNRCNDEIMEQFMTALQAKIDVYNKQHSKAPIILNATYILNSELKAPSFAKLLAATYDKMNA